MLPRLVWNSWAQVILSPWPPQVLGLQIYEPLCPGATQFYLSAFENAFSGK